MQLMHLTSSQTEDAYRSFSIFAARRGYRETSIIIIKDFIDILWFWPQEYFLPKNLVLETILKRLLLLFF